MATTAAAADWGRHLRAALALTGKSVDEAADGIHVSRKTLERTIRGERQPREHEPRALAETLGVPEWFLRHGLAGPTADLDPVAGAEVNASLKALATRLALLERNTAEALDSLAEDLAVIKQRVRRLSG